MKVLLSILLVSLLASAGCSISNSSGSFSDSSGSISDSISSPSKSSSDSSDGDDSGGDQKEAPAPAPETTEDTASYEKDVSQLTVTYIKSGGDVDAFVSSVAQLAKARGVTNWEADQATTRAIGMGAGQAGLQESDFDAFSKSIVGTDLNKLNEMRIGYQSAAPKAPEAS